MPQPHSSAVSRISNRPHLSKSQSIPSCQLYVWLASATLILLLPAKDVWASPFKCTDSKGHITYQQTQCSGSNEGEAMTGKVQQQRETLRRQRVDAQAQDRIDRQQLLQAEHAKRLSEQGVTETAAEE